MQFSYRNVKKTYQPRCFSKSVGLLTFKLQTTQLSTISCQLRISTITRYGDVWITSLMFERYPYNCTTI